MVVGDPCHQCDLVHKELKNKCVPSVEGASCGLGSRPTKALSRSRSETIAYASDWTMV
jgi:hypothetical protein